MRYGLPARGTANAVLYVEGFDGFVASTAAPTATGWSEPVAGRELHPLKTYTFFTAHYVPNAFAPNTAALNAGVPNGPSRAPNNLRYTLSGVSAVVFGAASTFTVSPNDQVTSDTVTLSDGGAGGAFSLSSLTFTSSSTAQIFTYTPTTSGTIALTAASGSGTPVTGSPLSLLVLPKSSLNVEGNLGSWSASTGSNGLAAGQSQCTVSFFIEYVSSSGSLSGNLLSNNAILVKGTGKDQVEYELLAASGSSLAYTHNFIPGIAYHVAMVWNNTGGSPSAMVYIDGWQVASITPSANTKGGSASLTLSALTAGALNYLISDIAIWNGTALSQSQVQSLANRARTPITIGTAASAWWTLYGAGQPVANAGGLADFTGNGNSFTTVSSSNAVYSSTYLNYTPTALIQEAYSDTSGYVVYIPLLQNIAVTNGGPAMPTTVLTAPTFTLNGTTLGGSNAPTQLQLDGYSYFVAYQLAAQLAATDVLTMSCWQGWAVWSGGGVGGTGSSGVGNSPLAVANNYSTDYYAVESAYAMPISQRSFRVGQNAIQGANHSVPSNFRANWVARLSRNWGGTVVAYDSNGLPSLVTATAGNTCRIQFDNEGGNGIDGVGMPFPYGYWTISYNDATPYTGGAPISQAGGPVLTVGMLAYGSSAPLVGSLSSSTWDPVTGTWAIVLVFNVQPQGNPATSVSPNPYISVYSSSHGTVSGTYNVAFQNLCITPPSPTSPTTDALNQNLGAGTPNTGALAIDPWALAKHEGLYAIRASGWLDNNSGDGNFTYASDLTHPLPSELYWNNEDGQTTPIAAISPVTAPLNVIVDYLGTTIAANVTLGATTITVADATNLTAGTSFLIDSEWMVVSAAPTGTSVPVSRASRAARRLPIPAAPSSW